MGDIFYDKTELLIEYAHGTLDDELLCQQIAEAEKEDEVLKDIINSIREGDISMAMFNEINAQKRRSNTPNRRKPIVKSNNIAIYLTLAFILMLLMAAILYIYQREIPKTNLEENKAIELDKKNGKEPIHLQPVASFDEENATTEIPAAQNQHKEEKLISRLQEKYSEKREKAKPKPRIRPAKKTAPVEVEKSPKKKGKEKSKQPVAFKSKSEPSVKEKPITVANCGNCIYVKKGGIGNGESWSHPIGDLQDALKIAKTGTKILVAEGKYFPTATKHRSITFSIPDGVELYGGFMGNETAFKQRDIRNRKTILSGNIGNETDEKDNSYTVILVKKLSTKVIIDGFVITGGNSSMRDGSNKYKCGGGLYLSSNQQSAAPKLVIKNCLFKNNQAVGGGAIYNSIGGYQLTSVKIENCEFVANVAENGGAIYNKKNLKGNIKLQIINSSFNNNKATQGSWIFNDNFKNTCVEFQPYKAMVNEHHFYSTLNFGKGKTKKKSKDSNGENHNLSK